MCWQYLTQCPRLGLGCTTARRVVRGMCRARCCTIRQIATSDRHRAVRHQHQSCITIKEQRGRLERGQQTNLHSDTCQLHWLWLASQTTRAHDTWGMWHFTFDTLTLWHANGSRRKWTCCGKLFKHSLTTMKCSRTPPRWSSIRCARSSLFKNKSLTSRSRYATLVVTLQV